MKQNGTLFKIGRVPTRIKLLLFYVAFLIGVTSFFPIVPAILLFVDNIWIKIAACLIFMVYMLISYLSFVPLLFEYWDLGNGFLKQYCPDSFRESLRFMGDVFVHGEADYTLSINLQNIQSIGVYWKTVRMPVITFKSYVLFLHVTMKDGSYIKLKALSGKGKQMFINAMEYLQNNLLIHIDDPDQLIDVLKDPNVKVYTYIDHLQKEALKKNQYIGSNFRQNKAEKRDDLDLH